MRALFLHVASAYAIPSRACWLYSMFSSRPICGAHLGHALALRRSQPVLLPLIRGLILCCVFLLCVSLVLALRRNRVAAKPCDSDLCGMPCDFMSDAHGWLERAGRTEVRMRTRPSWNGVFDLDACGRSGGNPMRRSSWSPSHPCNFSDSADGGEWSDATACVRVR